jgi:protoheme IX farnesyltransferase
LATVLGALFVALAVRVYRQRQGDMAEKAAKQLFAFSILYLFLLLAIIVAEHGLGVAALAAQ